MHPLHAKITLQPPNDTQLQTLSNVLTGGVVAAVSRVITAASAAYGGPHISINKWL